MESNPIADYGAVTVLGAAFLLILRFMMSQFTNSLKSIIRGQERHSTSIDAVTTTILTMQQILLAHDLTVTGINPSLGETVEERAKVELDKYTKLQNMIGEQKKAINIVISQKNNQEPII